MQMWYERHAKIWLGLSLTIDAASCVAFLLHSTTSCAVQMWYKGHAKIWLDLPLMIDAAFCAGAAMITFGAVLGKVSPTQLMYLLMMEVS